MSRHYSSMFASTSTASKSAAGGSVDPVDHTVVPSKADVYKSRPPVVIQQQHIRNLDGIEPTTPNNLQLVLQQNARPIIASRSVIITRSAPDQFPRNSRMYQSERAYRVANLGSVPPGSYSTAATNGVGAVVETRDKEKKDMQDLNERLANYLDKVRFLEAQNKNLACELERLKNKWGQETSEVKAMYQTELDGARKLLDDAVKEKGKLEVKVASLEEFLEELRGRLDDAIATARQWKEKWEGMIQKVSEAEAEAASMRRRTEGMEIEKEKDKAAINKLQTLLQNARQDLDKETILQIEVASKLQTTEEELDFHKSIHEQEINELKTLVHHDTTPDNRAFWKNEMGAALKEIQEMYDEKLEIIKTEMETMYNTKVQEFRTGATKSSMETHHSREENKRLKGTLVDLRDRLSNLEGQNLGLQREMNIMRHDGGSKERELEHENSQLKTDVNKLRAEIDAVMTELQHMMNSKLSLEMEISAYRKLLEGEEHRLTEVEAYMNKAQTAHPSFGEEKGNVDHNLNGSFQYSSSYKSSTKLGDVSRFSHQKSSKGACGVAESSVDGKFIVLENISRKDEDLGSWTIIRTINEADQLKYVLDDIFPIKANSKIKIWSRGNKPYGSSDVEAKVSSWGIGEYVVTKLLAPNGEERASYIQKLAN